MNRSVGDWLRCVTRAFLDHDLEAKAKLERPWNKDGYNCFRINRSIPESEFVDAIKLGAAIVCAIRDGNWKVLSIARSRSPNIEEFCGDFLDRMKTMAASEDEKALVQTRLAEFAKWRLENPRGCSS